MKASRFVVGGFLLAVSLFCSSCFQQQRDSQVHLVFSAVSPGEDRAAPTSVSSMNCLFVNVRGAGVTETFAGKTFGNGVTSSCLSLGTVSAGANLASAITDGIKLSVKPGTARVVEVLGYVGSLGSDCQGKTLDQILDRAAESLYLLGSSTVDLASDTRVGVANSYVSGQTSDLVDECTEGGGGPGPGPSNISKIFKYDGTLLSDLSASVNGKIHALYYESTGGQLYVGGDFLQAGGVTDANYIARYNVTTSVWTAVGTGLNAPVRAIVGGEADQIYIGGEFTNAGGTGSHRLVRWNYSTNAFNAVSTGFASGAVFSLFYELDLLRVGGTFPSRSITWSHLSSSFSPPVTPWTGVAQVNALSTISAGGILYIGGDFSSGGDTIGANYFLMDSAGFMKAGNSDFNGPVHSMLSFGGKLYAFGEFTQPQAGVSAVGAARFDALDWEPLAGGGISGIPRVSLNHLGTIFVGGDFTSAGGVSQARNIAKYTGSTWGGVSNGLNGPVSALASGFGSNVYIAGTFTGPYVAR